MNTYVLRVKLIRKIGIPQLFDLFPLHTAVEGMCGESKRRTLFTVFKDKTKRNAVNSCASPMQWNLFSAI